MLYQNAQTCSCWSQFWFWEYFDFWALFRCYYQRWSRRRQDCCKKTTKILNFKSNNSVSRFVVNDSNKNDNNDNNNNNENFFFRFWLTRFNERMTMIYIVNVILNNCLTVVMKNFNVLNPIELLKMTMSIKIVINREKTIEKKKQKKKKTKKKTKLTRQESFDALDVTRHWYTSEKKSIYCEKTKNNDKNVKMSWIKLSLYQEYFEKKTE